MFIAKIKRKLKTYKKFINISVIILAIIIILTGYLGYVERQVRRNEIKQQKIVEYLKINAEYQEIEKIKTHAIAIRQKMDEYKKTGNLYIDDYAMNLYVDSYKLALDGDKSCYVLEVFGDNIVEAYYRGLKEGNRMWSKSAHSF